MKLRAAHDLVISSHELAAYAFRAGLVDEFKLLIAPIILGGGTLLAMRSLIDVTS